MPNVLTTDKCNDLLTKLGFKVKYLPARLAIARSLSLSSPPPLLSEDDEDDSAGSMRGQQLFGDGSDPATWLALVTQHAQQHDITRKQFQSLIAAHWKRGADLLSNDWEHANGNFATFIAHLAELASLDGNKVTGNSSSDGDAPAFGGLVLLPVGEVAVDTQTQERISFPLNAAGGSPHMAIMGGAGSGKTRTAVFMLKSLRAQAKVPLLAFDFKGDLSDNLASAYEAEVVSLSVVRTFGTDRGLD